MDDKSLQDDLNWFNALTSNSDSNQAARLRQVLREAELGDAEKEDTTHDWQRLQFALRRENAQPAIKRPGYKFYSMAASVVIVVCASSVIYETIKEPGYSPSNPAPVAAPPLPEPPPVAESQLRVAPPPARREKEATREEKLLEAARQEIMQRRSSQPDMKMMAERPAPFESSALPTETIPPQPASIEPPRIMIAPLPLMIAPPAPPLVVVRGSAEQAIMTATPEQDANQLEAELLQLGTRVVREIAVDNTNDQIKLIVELTYPLKDEVRIALENRKVSVPTQGNLYVLFIKSAP